MAFILIKIKSNKICLLVIFQFLLDSVDGSFLLAVTHTSFTHPFSPVYRHIFVQTASGFTVIPKIKPASTQTTTVPISSLFFLCLNPIIWPSITALPSLTSLLSCSHLFLLCSLPLCHSENTIDHIISDISVTHFDS